MLNMAEEERELGETSGGMADELWRALIAAVGLDWEWPDGSWPVRGESCCAEVRRSTTRVCRA